MADGEGDDVHGGDRRLAPSDVEGLAEIGGDQGAAAGGLLIVSVPSVDDEDPWRWPVLCEVFRTPFPFCIARSSRTGLSVARSVA